MGTWNSPTVNTGDDITYEVGFLNPRGFVVGPSWSFDPASDGSSEAEITAFADQLASINGQTVLNGETVVVVKNENNYTQTITRYTP